MFVDWQESYSATSPNIQVSKLERIAKRRAGNKVHDIYIIVTGFNVNCRLILVPPFPTQFPHDLELHKFPSHWTVKPSAKCRIATTISSRLETNPFRRCRRISVIKVIPHPHLSKWKSSYICRWCTTIIYHWQRLVHLKIIIVFDSFIVYVHWVQVNSSGFYSASSIHSVGTSFTVVNWTMWCERNKNNALIGQEPTQEEIAIIIAHICNISHRTESNVAIIYKKANNGRNDDEEVSGVHFRVGLWVFCLLFM